MSLLGAGIMAAGALAGAIGKRRGRKASERAGRQQMKFLKEDAAAVREQYRDQAEQTREAGEKVLGTQLALAGKFGSVSSGLSASNQMVREESQQNLEQDVQNIIKQGDIEANRILNQRDQIKANVRTSKRTGWLQDISNVAGIAGAAFSGYQAFGGNPQLFAAEVGGLLNPFKNRRSSVNAKAQSLGLRMPYEVS